jgi:hypothetical protein
MVCLEPMNPTTLCDSSILICLGGGGGGCAYNLIGR